VRQAVVDQFKAGVEVGLARQAIAHWRSDTATHDQMVFTAPAATARADPVAWTAVGRRLPRQGRSFGEIMRERQRRRNRPCRDDADWESLVGCRDSCDARTCRRQRWRKPLFTKAVDNHAFRRPFSEQSRMDLFKACIIGSTRDQNPRSVQTLNRKCTTSPSCMT
jgi:hypothetical protein